MEWSDRRTWRRNLEQQLRKASKFCIVNDLIILNAMFIHKNIHKITREEPSNKEKLIVDYIIIQREMRKYIRDTREKRGP
jgi:hypothetical protein